MDDSCAVCAESLEWVAYGACGHREVCSTCVARLRFICDDRRCCICKAESDVVFVTKALGDYTRMINDFSVLPFEVREGQVGSYWYHVDTQSFFDDVDHYKMIKAMCRLSCSVCDKMEEQPNDGLKRRARFRNIEQLKGHLFHQHRLLMCSLCLEGRKIFICEQKLYTRAQLNQHISTGNSEVDGSESERGGFMGHPMCEFCRTPFYGDNELYTHMSSEHYTCHICQRQHPGQYEYYKNYDDLEIHFGREHFLCEDEACLAKKFIVFQSEAEMKRHNAIEHGGSMSRSKRNAALQIPTSFRYRRCNEQDHRRGRGRTFHRDSSDDQLSMTIQATFEAANVDDAFHDPSSSFSGQVASNHGDASDIDPIIQPFESLATTDSEPSSRYLQALGNNSRNVPLEESLFPPLPLAPSSSQKPIHDSEGLPNNTMAAHLRRQNNRNVSVFSLPQARQSTSHGPVLPPSSVTQPRPTTNIASIMSHGSGKPGTGNGPAPSTYVSSTLAQAQPAKVNGIISAGSSRNSGNSSWISHSASAPNLIQSRSLEPSVSDFPPVSATQMRKSPASSKAPLNAEDVQTANNILVEKIRSALEYDQDKFTVVRDMSLQYRQGSIDAARYLDYVQQFGLSHLVLDLARLCPDAQKQKVLVDTYNAGLRSNGPQEDGWGHGSVHLKDSNGSKKGKGKRVDTEEGNSKSAVADNIISTVRKLQASYKPSEEEEVLSKDGYRTAKGKSNLMVEERGVSSASQPLVKLRSQYISPSEGGGSNKKGDGGGGSKQRKKASKFHRVRLGDGSVAALLDLKISDPDPDPDLGTMDDKLDGNNIPAGVPMRGVWRKGGGHKLFSGGAK